MIQGNKTKFSLAASLSGICLHISAFILPFFHSCKPQSISVSSFGNNCKQTTATENKPDYD